MIVTASSMPPTAMLQNTMYALSSCLSVLTSLFGLIFIFVWVRVRNKQYAYTQKARTRWTGYGLLDSYALVVTFVRDWDELDSSDEPSSTSHSISPTST